MKIKKALKKTYDSTKILPYLFAFLSPILILMIIFMVKGINFDGERFSIGDMQAQYIDMIIYFKHMIQGGESIFYSFTKGLGGDMYSTIIYYMLSPLNFISLLFSDGNIMQGIYFIILIKFGLCSLTMFIYLNYKNKNKKLYSTIFALCYALMAYNINNYFCIMWFDAIYMAPLVMMGIEKLVHEKKVMQYIICLNLSIVFNFYMGYMICIFSVLYFIYLVILKYKKSDKKEIFDTIIRFITSSLLSGLSACVIYLPAVIDIMKANRDSIGPNNTSIIGTINRLFIGSYGYDSFLSYYQPNLYCGCLALTLLVVYFFNKKKTEKEKYATIFFIVIFVLSIFIPTLNLIWHGGSFPVGYNFRFSFLLCAFLLMLGFNEITSITKIDKKTRNAILLFALLIGIYSFGYNDTFYSWFSIGLFAAYGLILCIKKSLKVVFITVLIIVELYVNTYICLIPANNPVSYKSFMDNICSNFDDDNTYRVSGSIYYGTNELTACYKSTTKGFYSTLNDNISKFYTNIGYTGGLNYYDENVSGPPLIPSLLGVKYIYSENRINNYELLKEIDVFKYNWDLDSEYKVTEYIYENKEALNFGYLIRGYRESYSSNALEYQNNVFKILSGSEKDILVHIQNGYNENSINSNYIYIITFTDTYQVIINDHVYESIPPYTIMAFENNALSDEIKIEVIDANGYYTDQYAAYYLDLSAYLTGINNLKANQLENVVIDKNTLTGTITAGDNATLALSVPYEKGWTIYVDGIKTEYYSMYDMFTAVDLEPGEHTIKMVYRTRMFDISLIISIISIILTIIYMILCSTNEKIIKFNMKIYNKFKSCFSKKNKRKKTK